MAIFIPDYDEIPATYVTGTNNIKLGGRLVTNVPEYIADINGTRIIITGGHEPGNDADGNAVTWTVGDDVV